MSNLENWIFVNCFDFSTGTTGCRKQQQIFEFLNSTGTNWWATYHKSRINLNFLSQPILKLFHRSGWVASLQLLFSFLKNEDPMSGKMALRKLARVKKFLPELYEDPTFSNRWICKAHFTNHKIKRESENFWTFQAIWQRPVLAVLLGSGRYKEIKTNERF